MFKISHRKINKLEDSFIHFSLTVLCQAARGGNLLLFIYHEIKIKKIRLVKKTTLMYFS